MSEPLRTDPAHAPEPSGDADRASRIEQLLVSGLDCYFTGQYEQAINVWTRVVFLERGNGRARAYIERARSAMNERQRESEALLHQGVAAYQEGDVLLARELLTRAVEEGGTADEAMVFLQRLNRLTAAGSLRDAATTTRVVGPVVNTRATEPAVRRRWLMPVLILAAVTGGVALGSAPLVRWFTDPPGSVPAAVVQDLAAEPLPVVRPEDTMLVRARALHAGGHLRDALRALDRIDTGDPLHGEADRVRAEIQRDLLATASLDTNAPPETENSR